MYQSSNVRQEIFVILLCISCSWKVLAAVNQQHKPDAAGQRWFEKGWSRTTPSDYADSAMAGSRLQNKMGGRGSGAGPISDLDDGASGLGEDDEDTNAEIGSGSHSNSRFDVGSGQDISLPPTVAFRPSSISSTQAVLIDSTAYVTDTPSTSTDMEVTVEEEDTQEETTTLQAEFTTTQRSTTTTTTKAVTTKKTTTESKLFDVEATTTAKRTTTESVLTAQTTQRVTTGMPPRKDKPSILDERNKALPASFWMRPGVLAGLIGGAIAGLLAAILLVMFVVYRMRKKDEGSYALEEPKSPPTYAYAYQKAPTREFYA